MASSPGDGGGETSAQAGLAAAGAAGAPFPDCWLAYGATDPELEGYGVTVRLATGGAWLLPAQAAVAVGLLAVALGGAPAAARWIAAAACATVLGSGAVGALRLLATARSLDLRREHLDLTPVLGPARRIPWEAIGEIGLVSTPTRSAVGLRRRPRDDGGSAPRPPAGLSRLRSGFDYLLFPGDGDTERLGRVLLRYCIDSRARRRLPPATD